VIEVRTKGITMRSDVRVDAGGWHVFTLADGKHDAIAVLGRMFDAVDKLEAPIKNPEIERRWQALMIAGKRNIPFAKAYAELPR
jgi:hypothetical protein